jgi:hypothetical protein
MNFIKPILANPKTSIAGLAAIALGVAGLFGIHVPGMTDTPQGEISTGLIGLIGLLAKDAHSS